MYECRQTTRYHVQGSQTIGELHKKIGGPDIWNLKRKPTLFAFLLYFLLAYAACTEIRRDVMKILIDLIELCL